MVCSVEGGEGKIELADLCAGRQHVEWNRFAETEGGLMEVLLLRLSTGEGNQVEACFRLKK